MIFSRMMIAISLRYLLIVLIVLWVLVIVGEMFESARYLFSGKGSAFDVLMYFLCRTMVLLRLLLPVSWVVSVCLVFAYLGRNLELRALAAAGMGPFRMAAAILLVGLGLVVTTIAIGEFLVPKALERIETLMRGKFGRFDSTWRFFSLHHWFQGIGNRFFYIDQRLQDGRELRGVILLEMDEDFNIIRRTDFKKVVHRDGNWIGSHVSIRTFLQGMVSSYDTFSEKKYLWPEGVEHFRSLVGRPAQKPLMNLLEHIEEMKRRGISSVEYQMEFHNRFAIPLLGWLIILFATPWISMPVRQSSLAGALIQAVMLVFGAYLLVGLSTAAVSSGTLDAPWGAWLPVLIVALVSMPKWISIFSFRPVFRPDG